MSANAAREHASIGKPSAFGGMARVDNHTYVAEANKLLVLGIKLNDFK
jgi:hypothetical protein